jgi:hypothetical protein
VNWGKWVRSGAVFALLLLPFWFFLCGHTRPFNSQDMLILNVGIPVLQAGWRAHRHRTPLGRALLQALAGGLMMNKGLEQAAKTDGESAWKGWQAKIMMNLGASLAESAGKEFCFRMDIGPVWFLADQYGWKFRPGVHGTIAPLLNLAEGAKIDWKRSFRFGTMAFHRPQNWDGTIGSNGALAYSNANNFITDERGSHVGHELVHTFQYRRDAFFSPSLAKLVPEFENAIADNWVDDTGWSLNWAVQCAWSDLKYQDKDFDILMEREAYYLSEKYSPFRPK